jgi:hypothetical protein
MSWRLEVRSRSTPAEIRFPDVPCRSSTFSAQENELKVRDGVALNMNR